MNLKIKPIIKKLQWAFQQLLWPGIPKVHSEKKQMSKCACVRLCIFYILKDNNNNNNMCGIYLLKKTKRNVIFYITYNKDHHQSIYF